ncbi:hypothetical protein QWY75_01205 [Pontixanthobacter aestiaquae]|uniref:Inner membrane protein n=1 Tax=Pontixanthobacter aestiaquae TaxID=1509367 RepID=A0A844Z8N7_9SPHN|nr:hypothetical protein [Pontixanthobacter aestiaquae]MDN3644817.1 hypothetical protein [Pontixanthobacter aestiaquae]MXO84178.1 hypothetical protein [Pontixanthobacter aestiaquae]
MNSTLTNSRKSGSWSAILGVALSAFLLGAIFVGYIFWDGDYAFMSDEVEEPAAVDVEPQALASPGASPVPTATETEAVEEATEAVERVEEQAGGLDQRLAAAEQRLDRLVLQAEAASGNAGRAEGLLIAFAARRTLEKGERLGYLKDQLRLRFGAAQPEAVATIIEVSENPIRVDELIARLEGLGPDLMKSEEGPSLAKFQRELSQLFVIRSEDTASPRPDRALERARLALGVGRVRNAIKEVETLPGADKAEKWIADARRYAAVQNALDILETSAVKERSQLRDREGQTIEQASPAEDSGT